MNTKLIIVEGIPGSGKSATADFIVEHLQSQEVQCELFGEGKGISITPLTANQWRALHVSNLMSSL